MTRLDAATHAARIERLRVALDAAGCDGALLTNLASIRYLTGFTGTSALFAVTPARAHIVVDFRYTEQAAAQCPCEVTKREGGLDNGIGRWLDAVTRCALESRHVTLDLADRIRAASAAAVEPAATGRSAAAGGSVAPGQASAADAPPAAIAWSPQPDLVERLRLVKDHGEIERLRAACELLETLMESTIASMRPGVRELDVALGFELAARKATGRPLPFEPIIASGPRGALPHGVASEKTIAAGELVVIDIGLELDGYVADMTRTVAVGHADERMREVHEAVHLANRTAAQGIRPGMTGAEAHALAAGVLEARGLGDRFGHGLGHGIGVEIHEDPRLSPLGDETLQPGMVFTIEPGAYIPGWGGVRIEDAGVLTETGVEVFNRMERGLIVV